MTEKHRPYGENPDNKENLPGQVGATFLGGELGKKEARTILEKASVNLFIGAERFGKQIVFTDRRILFGIGLAATFLTIAAGTRAWLIRRHKTRDEKGRFKRGIDFIPLKDVKDES